MNRRFPIPRASLPQPNVSDLEHKASKQIMHQLLTHTLREFEQYAYRYSGGVDARRWKKQSSRDDLTVYRERKAGETGASVFDSLRECRLDLPTFSSTVETLASPTMLLTGLGPGRVEDAMSAIVTENQQDLALVVKYKHQDVADCAIVKTIEPPTQSEPYKYLGYKFFVRKSPTDGRLMKHRHSLYLEYCGMTHTSTGERIGFHIMHSVELPQFPDLTSYNSIRALQSTRYLFRQKSDRVVEVFMLGNMDIAGRMFKPLANMFTVETLVGVTRLLDLAEVRRLSQMAREQRRYGSRSVVLAGWSPCKACGLVVEGIKQKLLVCRLCGDAVCSKCTTSKRVFISDEMGILGDFKKVQACTVCVLRANTGSISETSKYDPQKSIREMPNTWPRSNERRAPSPTDMPSFQGSSLQSPATPVRREHTQHNGSHSRFNRRWTKPTQMESSCSDRGFRHVPDETKPNRRRAQTRLSVSPLRGSTSTTPKPLTVSTSAPGIPAGLTPSQSDMMSRLFELSKMAEATSTTTHLNGIYCEQHWREELKVEMEAIGSPELLRPVKTWV